MDKFIDGFVFCLFLLSLYFMMDIGVFVGL